MLCGTERNATMITNVKQDEEEKVVIDYMKQVSKFHLKKTAF
jgi:hypothetical protein